MFTRATYTGNRSCAIAFFFHDTMNSSRWVFLSAAAICFAATAGLAQETRAPVDDHQKMMDQLVIKALRRGPDPNNQSTFDEATANPFASSMPDPLILKNGTR